MEAGPRLSDPWRHCDPASRGRLRAAGAVLVVASLEFSLAGRGVAATAAPVRPEPVYPGKEWSTLRPEEAGMVPEKLDELRAWVGGRGCVVRYGYLVYSWGDVGRRADVASACKPWFTHFLLVAIEEGKVAGVDEKITRWEPRLRSINADLGHKDRDITWKHLANQISCYGVRERPGTAYDYNDFNMALFFDTLFLKVYGASWSNVDEKVLHPRLTGPLQCEDDPTLMAFGVENRPGRLGVSVRDFARFGLLYLRKGRWRGKQLLAEESVSLALGSSLSSSIPRTAGEDAEMLRGQRSLGGGKNQTDHLGSYSYAWWTNGVDREGKRHWPDAPKDAYGAFGHGGLRAMVILPGLDVILSWNDSRVDSREKENRALKLLIDACGRKE